MSDLVKVQTYLQTIDEVIEKGPFKDNWESLSRYGIPEWYAQAKFGLFVHWGVYSVPAYFNEWYSREMYQKGHPARVHHLKTYGKDFGYKDFIPQFTAENMTQKPGRTSLRKAGRNTLPQSASITTASKCIRASCANGTPLRWARSGISTGSSNGSWKPAA